MQAGAIRRRDMLSGSCPAKDRTGQGKTFVLAQGHEETPFDNHQKPDTDQEADDMSLRVKLVEHTVQSHLVAMTLDTGTSRAW